MDVYIHEQLIFHIYMYICMDVNMDVICSCTCMYIHTYMCAVSGWGELKAFRLWRETITGRC